MSDHPIRLVEELVEQALNAHDLDAVGRLMVKRYRDHSPLYLDPFLKPEPGGHFVEVEQIVKFLSRDEIDIRFTLEDIFTVNDRVAYRIFGEGIIGLDSLGVEFIGPPSALPAGALLGTELHVSYQCVGIFRVEGGQLAERWGAQILQ